MPVIPIATAETPQYTPYVPRTPSPGTYARFAARVGGFEVGRDIRPVAPATNYDVWADRNPTPPPATGIASSEFWDNVDIPYSAYFPSPRANSPNHRTPPPEALPMIGTSPYPGKSKHSSLYESRHPSPAPLPTSTPHHEAVGETSDHPSDPHTVLLEHLAGSSSQTGSSLSSSMRSRSQQETQREIGQQSRPATPARPLTHHAPLPPLDLPQITSPTRPQSRRNSRPPTPTEMTLSSAINFYEETLTTLV